MALIATSQGECRASPHRLLALLAALAVLASIGAIAPAGASAVYKGWDESTAYFRGIPVYFVHGISGIDPPWAPSSSDCAANWGVMTSRFRDFGYTGPFRTVKYYEGDVNCSDHGNVHHHGSHRVHFGTDYWDEANTRRDDGHTSTGGHNESADIRHLAYHLAWTIADHYHNGGSNQTNVNIVAHSMGGLIARYMIARWQLGQENWPPVLMVANVVTLGTPHLGTGNAHFCSWDSRQCAQMTPGSEFLTWLENYGQNPQGFTDTDWTLVGAGDDDIVSEGSATGMKSAHKVLYDSGQAYEHSDYQQRGRGIFDADVRWDEGWDGQGYFPWSSAPHGVRWSYRASASLDW